MYVKPHGLKVGDEVTIYFNQYHHSDTKVVRITPTGRYLYTTDHKFILTLVKGEGIDPTTGRFSNIMIERYKSIPGPWFLKKK